jgi:two-component system sensor histidine kinase BaeS
MVASLDPTRMRQALGNLVDNALRHSERGGSVELEASRDEGWLTLRVTDRGDGFPDGFAASAFEPFRRADEGRDRDTGGVGLGLAIVRAVAEAHGGSATASNPPGCGAMVTLRLPQGG